MRRITSHWIAVSEAERLHLVRNLGVAADRISVVRNFVPPRSAVSSASPTKADLGTRHGLPSDSTWVVAIGNLAPVKGPETFAAVAAAVRRRLGAGVSFVWIGDGRESPYGRGVMRHPDAGEVLWVGPSENPRPWLLAASMLVVTSLEESCSLVALEAAQLGCPVLAFAGTGGIDESLADGAGRLVAERSSATMAAAVIQWIQDPDAARQAAEAARVRVGAEADRGRQCEAIAAVLERLGT
jgi:glycosyltransferase involved in cell wall biosynthesis